MTTSQNGWPASPDPSAIGVKSYKIPGTDISVRLAAKAAPLLLAAAAEWNEKIEPLEGKVTDDWSYAYREIRGVSGTLSNHSSATALDLNATKHPMGKTGTFTVAQRNTLKKICDKYGLRAGEFYPGRVDGMHIEVNCSPAEAVALVKKLGLAPDGTTKPAEPVVKPAEVVPDYSGSYKRGDKGKAVLWIQKRLKKHGLFGLPTGVYGGVTENKVKEFQKMMRLKQSGIVDERTWKKLAG